MVVMVAVVATMTMVCICASKQERFSSVEYFCMAVVMRLLELNLNIICKRFEKTMPADLECLKIRSGIWHINPEKLEAFWEEVDSAPCFACQTFDQRSPPLERGQRG